MKVGVYPSPFERTPWASKIHPILKVINRYNKKYGIHGLGIKYADFINPKNISIKYNVDIIHIHWPEDIILHIHKRNHIIFKLLAKLSMTKLIDRIIDSEVTAWVKSLKSNCIPIVYQVHDTVAHGFTDTQLVKIDLVLRKKLIDSADVIVFAEKSAIEDFSQIFEIDHEKVYIIPIGDYKIIHGKKISKKIAQKKLKIAGSKKLILSHIGSIRENRNPDELINLVEKTDQAILVIAGNDAKKYHPSKYIKLYSGYIDHSLIRDILCASDYVVNFGKNNLTSAVTRASISYGVPLLLNSYGSNIDMAKGAAIFANDIKSAYLSAITTDESSYLSMVRSAIFNNSRRSWDNSSRITNRMYKQLIAIYDK